MFCLADHWHFPAPDVIHLESKLWRGFYSQALLGVLGVDHEQLGTSVIGERGGGPRKALARSPSNSGDIAIASR